MHARPAIAITGLGALSAVGCDVAELWQAISQGRSGIGPITRFSTAPYTVRVAAEIPGITEDESDGFCLELAHTFALTAAREAWQNARVEGAASPARVALVFGTSTLHRQSARGGPALHEASEALAAALGIGGPRITVSTACVSSALAMGLGRDLLLAGDADLVLVGGVCILSEPNFAGFHALGVLSPEPCAPFGEPHGTSLGEGAAFLVLERLEDALHRGATVRARLEGYGTSADAYHPTAPDPRGGGVARAISSALRDAGLTPEAIDYVKLHATGTTNNDPAEWRAVQQVFGVRAATLPVSGLKGMLGHTQDACGVLEALVTLLALEHGVLPPTLNCSRPRRNGPVDPVPGPLPRPGTARRAVCTSSAFGGANAAIVLALPDVPPPPTLSGTERSRDVLLLGAGIVNRHGSGLGGILPDTADGQPRPAQVPSTLLEELTASEDTRGLDPSCLWLTAAATLAMRDAGIRVVGALREQAGLLLGVARESGQSASEFWDSLDGHGPEKASARAFAHIVLNAPAGACARLLGLRGPHGAVSTGSGSGLLAVLVAARMLETRPDTMLMVAGGVDETLCPEATPGMRWAGISPSAGPPLEGAACVVLGVGNISTGRAAVRLAGWCVAGPGALPYAIETALQRAGLARDAVEAVFGVGLTSVSDALEAFRPEALRIDPSLAFGSTEASGSVVALAAALATMREGLYRVTLVLEGSSHSASLALVLTPGG